MTMNAEFRAVSRRTLTIAVAVLCSSSLAAQIEPDLAPGAKGDTTADGVLGQLDFVHNIKNFVDGRGINSSQDSVGDVAIDKSPAGPAPDRVFIVDRANHRVLGWKNISAFATNAPADLVIGQPDFNSNIANNGGISAASLYNPTGVAVDSKGNLYIADYSNHRVLFYQAPFAKGKSAGIAADDVFGQFGSFATANPNDFGISAATLNGPVRIAVDAADNVYIADQINHRVLEFNTPQKVSAVPGSGDTTADRVFGQLDAFNTGACNLNTSPSAKTLPD
jgi:NHL repeat